jgi:tRNA A37 methylthiotransferase MiaB
MRFEINEASLPTRNIYWTSKIREVMPHACIGVDVIVGFLEKQMNIF